MSSQSAANVAEVDGYGLFESIPHQFRKNRRVINKHRQKMKVIQILQKGRRAEAEMQEILSIQKLVADIEVQKNG